MFIGFFSVVLLLIVIAATWAQRNYSVYEVQGQSMEPTLSQGDSVLLHRDTELQRGHIVVFTKPSSWEHTSGDGSLLIKRILAVPGDSISLKDNAIYVNDKKRITLDREYSCPWANKHQSKKLSSHQIFAIGDNAPVSVDSRRTLCTMGIDKALIDTSAVVNKGTISLSF